MDRPRWFRQQKTPTTRQLLRIIHTQCRPRHRIHTRIHTRTRTRTLQGHIRIRIHIPRRIVILALEVVVVVEIIQCKENQRHHRSK